MPSDAAGIAASGIAEADVEAPRRAHQRAMRIDALRHGDGVGERHIDDLAVAPGNHTVEASGGDQVDRMDAKHRADQAVDRVGLAAALDMAEHGDAGLSAGQAGERLAEAVAGPAIARAPAAVALINLLAPRVLCPPGDGDQGVASATPA